MERESSLERSRAQLEVDWQRRCEDTEREVYMKQEQLMAGLTKHRDQVIMTVVMIKTKKKNKLHYMIITSSKTELWPLLRNMLAQRKVSLRYTLFLC